MNAQEFCFWLQGYAELTDKTPTAEQWKSIKEHLQLTFLKVTPPLGGIPGPKHIPPNPLFDPSKLVVTC